MPLEIMDNTFLVTEAQDKIAKAIELLQKYGEIENNLSLREVYNKYFHPNVLPIDDDKCWEALQNNSVLNVFQFDSDVGSQAAKKIHPHTILELADANGLMRLMTAEKGEEAPMDKYIRYKENIQLWYDEMDKYGLTKEEQKLLEPYFKQSYGVPPSQEQLMRILMDENLCHFTLAEANNARKVVGKKLMNKIPDLRKKVIEQAPRRTLGEYIWKFGLGPQMGYSFSIIHALAYSFIGFQTLYIATHWNPIYWNTACLIVNSGSLEEEEDFEEDDEGNIVPKKEKTTDYSKIAKALGDILSRGINISLIDINKSNYSFEPDTENNQILFGLKALSGLNDGTIEQIMSNRPYSSIKDFMKRCPLNKTAMISLIKGGAFDKLEKQWGQEENKETRVLVMAYYISQVCEPKKRITLQNFNGLMQYNLIPQDLDFQKRVFVFNKYLKTYKKVGKYYVFDESCINFYEQFFDNDLIEIINGCTCILQTRWDKIYKDEMDLAREYFKNNQNKLLNKYNTILFQEMWNKYAKGSLSAWEMEALCFYYHEHELAKVNRYKYGIVDFFHLSEKPEVDYTFKRNGQDIPIFKTYKIIGTVINKNDTKSSINLLTTTGIVSVKFTKEYYAMFNRQLSEKQEDGTKKIVEKGWMTRGTKLMITGFRRDDTFVGKTYSRTPTHQLYLIENVDEEGNMTLRHERYQVKEEEI